MEVLKQKQILADCSTFKLGGPCENLYHCKTPDELVATVSHLTEPFLLIGDGSNILFSDHGYEGAIIRFTSEVPDIEVNGNEIRISGATSLDALAKASVEQGLEGLVCCSGIPGTVGGAIAGNAGAWGKQVGDGLTSVQLMNQKGEVSTCYASELQLSYRTSRLKKSHEVVLEATFNCPTGSAMDLQQQRDGIMALRTEKHPPLSSTPCIGSIFKNIEPTSATSKRKAAGWFLENAGAKDFRVGGAYVFEKHANIIVKGENCTAQDVHDLCGKMQKAVLDQFGMTLKREVRFLGTFERAIPHNPFTFF